MKEKIAITVLEFDGQYDVEVFSWIDSIASKGDLIEAITEYGFDDQDGAIQYIQDLKETYTIVKLEQVSEEDMDDAPKEGMTEEAFWELIDSSLEQKDLKTQREWLVQTLAQMSDDNIQGFGEIIRSVSSSVYYHEQRQNAYRLAGVYGNDDSVDDFCMWLISRGKDVMEDVLRDPMEVTYYLNEKNLNEYGEATNELFGYATSYAMEAKRASKSK